MKFKQIIEFLVGFFGPAFLIWFFTIRFSKFNLRDIFGVVILVFGLVFSLYFMFLLGKSTVKMPGFVSHAKLKNEAYFTKGLALFSAVTFIFAIISGLIYAIIPGLLWLWSGE